MKKPHQVEIHLGNEVRVIKHATKSSALKHGAALRAQGFCCYVFDCASPFANKGVSHAVN